jgi:hypothetical protein
MNISELLNTGAINVSVSIKIGELKEFAVYLIEETKKELQEVVLSEKMETYPTAEQVCEILNVNSTTLWRYGQKGYLVSFNVGGKRRYRMSEVKEFLHNGNKKKK